MIDMKKTEKHANPAPSNRKQLSNGEQTSAHTAVPPTAQVILLLHGGQLCAWQATPGLLPKALLIKGETQLTVRDAPSLGSAWEDVATRLRDDGISIGHTLWVADAPGRQWCAEQKLAEWQLPWEWLAQRFGLGDVALWDALEDAWQAQILPWLITTDDAAQHQQLQRTRESEHASETERLAAERAVLALDNERLRAQNAALQQVDAERLASFLPALYPRVFTAIGPADLALLCGRTEPLALPNPYPEPVEETLRTLQKRFRALPQPLQKQIIRFMADLPHSQKLQLRPEMRELVDALQDN